MMAREVDPELDCADCSVEVGGETFITSHGEYFLDVSSCMSCLCLNGQATLCEPSTCAAISLTPTGCEYQGTVYSHGEQFDVS